jgi:hypothetical protein
MSSGRRPGAPCRIIQHLFLERPNEMGDNEFERTLYLIRRELGDQGARPES